MGALRATLSFGVLTAFTAFTINYYESKIFPVVDKWNASTVKERELLAKVDKEKKTLAHKQ